MQPESRIIRFLKKHHVLTLATVAENLPWCANCFYAYMEEENCLVFTSDRETKHIRDVANQLVVAGSVVLETRVIGNIQGIQFRGTISEPDGELAGKANSAYLRRFPYAALMDTTLWTVDLSYIKLTDNRLGFGKKLIWEKQ
jgi:uncharacterized protein